MMSRPHSPFKRSSRPPSQSSPGRSSPTRHFRGNSFSDDMSPRAFFASSNGSADNAAGPSRQSDWNSTSGVSRALSRAEHYDVVLEGEAGKE